jgi:D-glycero-alpha-D-manno-heptose 1-phosphate guanylyltransferase
MIRTAIILAGGLGSRLREVIGSGIPKPMAAVAGRPFLEYLLAYLNNWGLTRVIMAAGYRHAVIQDHFGNRFLDMELLYSIEDEPLGTGGAVKKALNMVKGNNVYVINGDTYFDVNLRKMDNFHQAKPADLTMAVRKVADISRYGKVSRNEENRITGFTEKGVESGMGYANGGTYILNINRFSGLDFPVKFSFEKDYIEKFYHKQQFFGFGCYGYFLDIGIPDDYEEAQTAFEGLHF